MTVHTPFGTFKKMGGMLKTFRDSLQDPLIQEGARLQQLEQGAPVWVVERIANIGGCTAPHARLFREDAPDRVKTLSLDVLLDGDHYRPATH